MFRIWAELARELILSAPDLISSSSSQGSRESHFGSTDSEQDTGSGEDGMDVPMWDWGTWDDEADRYLRTQANAWNQPARWGEWARGMVYEECVDAVKGEEGRSSGDGGQGADRGGECRKSKHEPGDGSPQQERNKKRRNDEEEEGGEEEDDEEREEATMSGGVEGDKYVVLVENVAGRTERIQQILPVGKGKRQEEIEMKVRWSKHIRWIESEAGNGEKNEMATAWKIECRGVRQQEYKMFMKKLAEAMEEETVRGDVQVYVYPEEAERDDTKGGCVMWRQAMGPIENGPIAVDLKYEGGMRCDWKSQEWQQIGTIIGDYDLQKEIRRKIRDN